MKSMKRYIRTDHKTGKVSELSEDELFAHLSNEGIPNVKSARNLMDREGVTCSSPGANYEMIDGNRDRIGYWLRHYKKGQIPPQTEV